MGVTRSAALLERRADSVTGGRPGCVVRCCTALRAAAPVQSLELHLVCLVDGKLEKQCSLIVPFGLRLRGCV